MTDKTYRVLVAKPGLDGHDRGAKVVARGLRDAGFEVIYTGLHQTPEMIARAALDEDVDAVGISVMSGAHMTLMPRIVELLRKQGQGDVVLFGGGIIPDEDMQPLAEAGIEKVFLPGASITEIVAWLRERLGARARGVKLPVYMDHHATTPVDGRVLERMLPYFSDVFGNASSRNHAFGWRAEEAVEAAREEVARLIGATAREIVFTSGATEANNLAIFGVAAAAGAGRHVITQATEHKAVLDPCQRLAQQGWRVTVLPVDRFGRVDPEALAAAITPATALVSIMTANNEIGTVQPIAAIGAICKARGVLFHTDATQAAGELPVNVQTMGVDLLSMSAHKMYGPKGVGALYVRRKDPRVTLAPQILGGGHERGVRSGTLNVPGIVGFGAAARLAQEGKGAEIDRLRALRDRLYGALAAGVDGVTLHGHPEERHPGNLNLAFADVEGEPLILGLRADVAVSSGAACASATLEPSHVLRAIGVSSDVAHSSVRFGLGRSTTQEEVDYVATKVTEKALALRSTAAAERRGRSERRGGRSAGRTT